MDRFHASRGVAPLKLGGRRARPALQHTLPLDGEASCLVLLVGEGGK